MSTVPTREPGILRADWEFLASAVSNAIWGDDRYRDMRRKEFLIAVRRELKRSTDSPR